MSHHEFSFSQNITHVFYLYRASVVLTRPVHPLPKQGKTRFNREYVGCPVLMSSQDPTESGTTGP